MQYINRVGVALSVLFNVLTGGASNQTFSARNWDWKKQGRWNIVWLIDAVLGMKGMLRKRKHLSRGYRVEMGKAMRKVHLGKVTVYLETKGNSHSVRQLRHFAG